MPETTKPEWVHNTPEDCSYELTMYDTDRASAQLIDIDRAEYEELKRLLAVRRGHINAASTEIADNAVPADDEGGASQEVDGWTLNTFDKNGELYTALWMDREDYILVRRILIARGCEESYEGVKHGNGGVLGTGVGTALKGDDDDDN